MIHAIWIGEGIKFGSPDPFAPRSGGRILGLQKHGEPSVRSIRVVVGHMPRLLRDVVVGLVGTEPDMQVVAEGGGEADALLQSTQADIFVFDDTVAAGAGQREDLLRDHARLKLLVLSAGGRAAELHWLEPRSQLCLDVTPGGLVELIRAAVEGRGA